MWPVREGEEVSWGCKVVGGKKMLGKEDVGEITEIEKQ